MTGGIEEFPNTFNVIPKGKSTFPFWTHCGTHKSEPVKQFQPCIINDIGDSKEFL